MKLVHVAFYPSDWLAGTRGMSSHETGVYITLIAMMYEMQGPIQRDDKRLARACGCQSGHFKRALEYLIDEGKITVENDTLFNRKAKVELEKVHHLGLTRKQAANARWSKKPNKNNDGIDASASVLQCYPEPEPDIEKRIDKSIPKKKRKTSMKEDAEISEKQRAAATKRNLSQQEAEAQFKRFKNDALAKGKTFMDWDRAFITWLDSPYFKMLTEKRGDGNDATTETQQQLRSRRQLEVFIRGASGT